MDKPSGVTNYLNCFFFIELRSHIRKIEAEEGESLSEKGEIEAIFATYVRTGPSIRHSCKDIVFYSAEHLFIQETAGGRISENSVSRYFSAGMMRAVRV